MLRLRHRKLCAAAFSPNADRIATVGPDGVLRVWELATGESVVQLAVDESGLAAVAFAGELRVVTGANSGELVTWDLETFAPIRQTKLPYAVNSVLEHAQHGCFVGVSDVQHGNHVYRVDDDGTALLLVECNYGSGRWSLAISPDGRHLAAMCTDGHWMEFVGLWLLELPSGRVVDGGMGGSLYSAGSVAFRDNGILVFGPDPWKSSGYSSTARMSLVENLRDSFELWCEPTTALLPDGRFVSRSWRDLLLGGEAAAAGYIDLESHGPESALLITSHLGHVATGTDDELIVFAPGEVDALARTDLENRYAGR